jgi:hypothetical protein
MGLFNRSFKGTLDVKKRIFLGERRGSWDDLELMNALEELLQAAPK